MRNTACPVDSGLKSHKDFYVVSHLNKLLPIFALIALSDIHWGAMQLVTWVEMTVDAVSQEEPVLASVYQSVTGEKKCPRCCQIEQGREKDSRQAVQWESKTLAYDQHKREQLFPPKIPFQKFSFEHQTASSRRDAPQQPPPWRAGIQICS